MTCSHQLYEASDGFDIDQTIQIRKQKCKFNYSQLRITCQGMSFVLGFKKGEEIVVNMIMGHDVNIIMGHDVDN